ncbi:hypothetical protein RFI_07940 [Reticulomyxa filosa]|uniref:Uncharacterized protein n=1 Tax=Reticulomyxa filosa TaxID=46433 RepID=X6NT45_RETFI|nr:hypothetical protein RFI_07940 [Reticulomyxa filosa]|eukprot:ETO29186.1 hypothetical protein RFI_07940 [Reticulomyxa filosa]
MQLQAKDIFGERASLYALENDSWQKIGTGELTLTYNPYHPKELILKIVPDNSQDVFVFQIKPKVKAKGPLSWVLKGLVNKTSKKRALSIRCVKKDVLVETNTFAYKKKKNLMFNTKTKEEQILATRFAETYASEEFQRSVDGAIRNSRAHVQELLNMAVPNEEKVKLASEVLLCVVSNFQ